MNKITGAEKRQLGGLKNNEYFNNCFSKLVLNRRLEEREAQYILSAAIIFFRYYNNDRRLRGYFNIGYYIVLKYGIVQNDFKPLYDISLQIGFYPISNFMIGREIIKQSFVHEILINKEIRNKYKKENYIETVEQFNRSNEILENIKTQNSAYIAPTSYGKSSIIREVILRNAFRRIAIIVPTKSLITQTYDDVRKLELNYRLILHDEMYNGEENFIGILTQERATRLINKTGIFFDILFIDEAHNLLDTDSRNLLLSRLIMLNYKRNNNQRLLYLSPLVSDAGNLKVKKTNDAQIRESTIKHNLKAFDTYFLEKSGRLNKYNRFTDELYSLGETVSFAQYIIGRSKNKNFIYAYRPKFVERIAQTIYDSIEQFEQSERLNKISKVISEEIFEDIALVDYVKKGIVYLHGKLPNLLKEYLEYSFKELQEFKYVIANSVILEGINFPIDNLFITSTYSLTSKGLNNLIGRVNRLNYVFQESLNKLLSEIHFVDSIEFANKNGEMINKLSLLRDHSFTDEAKNPLLENYDIDELSLTKEQKATKRKKDERIIAATEYLIEFTPESLEDRIKHYFIESGIDDFYYDVDVIVPLIANRIRELTYSNEIVHPSPSFL